MKVRVYAKQRRRLPDHLHDVRIERTRQFIRRVLGAHVGGFGELDLYQLPRAKRVVHGLSEGVRQAVMPDVDGCREVVRLGAQRGALFRRKGHTRK